jgi:hypothetical protein
MVIHIDVGIDMDMDIDVGTYFEDQAVFTIMILLQKNEFLAGFPNSQPKQDLNARQSVVWRNLLK